MKLKKSIYQNYIGGYALIDNFSSEMRKFFQIDLMKIQDIFTEDGFLKIIPENGDVTTFHASNGVWVSVKNASGFGYKMREIVLIEKDEIHRLDSLENSCIISLYPKKTGYEDVLSEANRIIDKSFSE